MKKPHEQEWQVGPTNDFTIQVGEALEVHVKAAFWRHPEGEAGALRDATALLSFLKAAPDMVRALMDVTPIVGGKAHSPLCGVYGLAAGGCHDTCADIDAALRKAGVLK